MAGFDWQRSWDAHDQLGGLQMSLRRLKDLGEVRAHYGTSRVLRFLIADVRGRGLYARQFLQTRSVFIHVPKAAGSSVAKALYGKEQGHYPCILFRAVSPVKFREFFKFGFVRNPWDRVVSAYHFLSQGGKIEADRIWSETFLADISSFPEFVRHRLAEPKVLNSVHFRSQSHFLCDSMGRVAVDFLGRYENLQEDFLFVAARVRPGARLPSANKSRHDDFRSYYDAETRDIVASLYSDDVERFGYAFDS